MRIHRQATTVRRSLLSLAIVGSLMLLAIPRAYAADNPCPDGDADTSQGAEDSEGITGENTTCDVNASAYGWMNVAGGGYSSAFGFKNWAIGDGSSAFGFNNTAYGMSSSAFGYQNSASGFFSSAFGYHSSASGYISSAFGYYGTASGDRSLVLSSWWNKNGNNSMDTDETSSALGTSSVALGAGATAWDNSSVAIGVGSVAGNSDASLTTGANSVSVGTWSDYNGNGVLDPGETINAATGRMSSAFGVGNTASGDNSSASGYNNTASGIASNAFGYRNTASGFTSSAFGYSNYADGDYSSAFGMLNTASGSHSSAFGLWNTASGNYSSAFGFQSQALQANSTALGYRAVANVAGVVSFGHSASDLNIFGVAYGSDLNARLIHVADGVDATDAVNLGQLNTAIAGTYQGWNLSAAGGAGEAIGDGETVDFEATDANGNLSVSRSGNTITYGFNSLTSTFGGVGGSFSILGGTSINMGGNVIGNIGAGVAGTDAVNLNQLNSAIGGISTYSGWNISAGGGTAQLITSGDAVDFETDDANGNLTVSRSGNTITYGFNSLNPVFGGGGGSFTIVNNTTINMGGNVVGNLANGVAATDAATVGQVNTVAGSAAAAQTAADNAQASADAAQSTADTALDAANNAQTTADAAMDAANNAQASADHAQDTADHAQQSADAAQASADHAQATADTALTAAGNAVTTANTYTDTREAAIRTDMSAGDAATLASSKAYTDQRFAAWNDTFTQYQHQVDARFAQTDTRINRIGAMGTAMTQMAVNAAIGASPRGRLAVGVGTQGGQGAISIGYGRRVGSTGSFSIGASFASGESSVGAGFGIDL